MRHKETNQRKAAQQLGLRLSSRRTRTRGRQELIPFLAGLRQLVVLIPRPQPSLGCAATGVNPRAEKLDFYNVLATARPEVATPLSPPSRGGDKEVGVYRI